MSPKPNPPEGSSEVSSEDSSISQPAGSPYVGSQGPGFDPSQPPPGPPVDEAQPSPAEAFAGEWEEEQVRDWLRNAGALGHAGFGVGEADWAMTEADLDRIAPPATRILNRYQPTRLVAAYSDPAAVAIGFGLYGWRSALERVAVLREHEGEEQEPAAGPSPPPPAPGGAGQPINGEGPAVADGYVPAAARLTATRQPPLEDQ